MTGLAAIPRRAPRSAGDRAVECLEPRTLLTFAGPEFLVNASIDHNQFEPVVASDPRGTSVIVWSESTPSESNVFAQRYDAAGEAQGDEFRVNTNTSGGNHLHGSVAMDAAGGFVITFIERPFGPAPQSWTYFARRYNAAGEPQGEEFVVTSGAYDGDVAMDAAGGFVITYSVPYRFDTAGYARLYDAQGVQRGSDFGVFPDEPPTTLIDVAMDADGDMVFALVDAQYVYAWRFNSEGVAQGDMFRVGETANGGNSPAVAMDPDGDFVVAWTDFGGNGDVYARQYDAAGAATGNPFRVHAASGGLQGNADVAVDADGDFVITWDSMPTRYMPADVYARRFSADGAARGTEFRVNTTTAGGQLLPHVAMDADGDFIIVWLSGPGVNPYFGDVFARRYIDHPAVVGRYVFYHGSAFDAAGDDAAIAPDKRPLLPGQATTFANVTSYSRGINGVMVDLNGMPTGASLTAADFSFRSGRSADGSDFAAGPVPVSVTVRQGAGAGGSDRVTLIWGGDAVQNGWLEVTLKAGTDAGLAGPDVFSFGNLVGETGDGGGATGWRISALDLGAVKRALNTAATLTAMTDVNRDGRTNALDLGVLKRNLNQGLAQWAAPVPPLAADAPRARRAGEDVL